jgi:hypothetical protein
VKRRSEDIYIELLRVVSDAKALLPSRPRLPSVPPTATGAPVSRAARPASA